MIPKIPFRLVLLSILTAHAVSAQVPFLKSVSKMTAASQETISIQGLNFGTNAANVKVTFGAASATPVTISDQLIEVKVPAASTFDNIGVTNTSSGLAGYSPSQFVLSYGGTSPFNAAQLSSQSDFFAEDGLYDLTIADFDGDGKADVATANKNSTNISIFLNASTPGSVSFTKSAAADPADIGVFDRVRGSRHTLSRYLPGDSHPSKFSRRRPQRIDRPDPMLDAA